MDLKELEQYFAGAKGTGVLATADASGQVDAAIYSRPHFMDDGLVAFIMPDKLTHVNLGANPHACFLFQESGSKAQGRRLYLTKVGEETDPELIAQVRRSHHGDEKDNRFLVKFQVDKVLPLVGGEA